MSRKNIHSGSPFEPMYGYCRAVAIGDRVIVGGTAPVWPNGEVDPDPLVQVARCFEIILAALAEAGAGPSDVVQTRMYITDPAYADAVGRAHAAIFADIRPVATMVVVAALIDERWKVEIEAEAVLS